MRADLKVRWMVVLMVLMKAVTRDIQRAASLVEWTVSLRAA